MLKRLDENECTGCQTCVDVCPEDVLRFDEDRKKPYVAYPEDCIGCGVCATKCPPKVAAIRIE